MSLSYSLLDAVKESDLALVKELLQYEAAEINFKDECGYTPLHWAIMYGKTEIVHALISDSGCNVNIRDSNHYTGIHLAIKHGFKNILQLLINYGASIDMKTKGGRSSEDLAIVYNRWEFLDALQQAREIKRKQIQEKPKIPCLGKLLGCGAFGQVFLGQDVNSGRNFAVKCIETVGQRLSGVNKHVQDLDNEIRVLQNLTHANILRYYSLDQKGSTMRIYMEYMPGGNMHEYALSCNGLLESKVKSYTQQIVSGVEYLHTHMVIHRDIKGGNILLDSTHTNIKLADFGLAKKIERCSVMSNLQAIIGSPYWMAPEVIKATSTGNCYGRRADIWSIGCTVVEMLTTQPPFSNLEPMTAIYNIGSGKKSPELPQDISSTLRDFLHQCFKRDPKSRPTSTDLLHHPFLKTDKDSTSSLPGKSESGESKMSHTVELVSRHLKGIFDHVIKRSASQDETVCT